MGLDEIAVFDHLTAMSLSALNTVWKGEIYAQSEVPADDTTSYNIWRQQGWLLTDFMQRVQQSPFNVICIAQEAMTKFEDGSKKICPDIGTGNLSATSPSFFDHIIHCDKANDKFKFTSIKNTQAIVGSRDGVAIEDLKVPSLVPFFPPLGVEREKVVVVSDGKIVKPNIVTPIQAEIKSLTKEVAQVDKLEAMRAKLAAKKVS
jgi:outer membrane protein assembly factor BamB